MTVVLIGCPKLKVTNAIETQDMPPVNVAEVFSLLVFVLRLLVVNEEFHSSRLAIGDEPVVKLHCRVIFTICRCAKTHIWLHRHLNLSQTRDATIPLDFFLGRNTRTDLPHRLLSRHQKRNFI